MKRILGSLLASCLLLTGCGKLRSPDFVPVLAGIQISPQSAEITQASQTVTFTVVGLYTTPPGTKPDATTVPCTGSNSPSGLCTVSALSSGASYTVSNPAIASIRADGVASALRNGTVNVVATAENFQSAPAVLTVRVPVLQTLRISPLDPTVAQGLTQLFSVQGTYSDSPATLRPVADTVNWSSLNTSIATVSPAQGTSTTARTLAIGGTTITASAVNFDGNTVSASTSLTVGEPELISIVFTPSSLTLPAGTSMNVLAQGIYTDSNTPRQINTTVTWSSSAPTVATATTPGNQSMIKAVGTPGQQTTITASSPKKAGDTGTPITAQLAVSISSAVLVGIDPPTGPSDTTHGLQPQNPVIAATFTQQFRVIGTFSDGTTAQVPASSFDWVSATTAAATINANGLATGVAQGSSIITATLKSGVSPEITNPARRTAATTLTVTDAVCTGPILKTAGATTTTAKSPTCLVCAVTNPDNAIDNDANTAATMSVTLGVVDVTTTLNAISATTITPVANANGSPQRAGFIISRPPGQLLSVGLLSSQLTVNTLDANGVVVETDGGSISDALRLTLLGQFVAGEDVALISLPVTKPFKTLQIVFDSGTVGAVDNVLVGSACSTVVPPVAP